MTRRACDDRRGEGRARLQCECCCEYVATHLSIAPLVHEAISMDPSDPADPSVSRRSFLVSGAASATTAATAAAPPTFATSPDAPAGPHLVVSRIERPPADVVARFKKVVREFVTDAVGRSQWMDLAIKPVADRDWSLCGPAVTVKLEAVDHLMCIAALGVAQPGDVIVVAANGVTHTAVWGGGLTLSAKNLGRARAAGVRSRSPPGARHVEDAGLGERAGLLRRRRREPG